MIKFALAFRLIGLPVLMEPTEVGFVTAETGFIRVNVRHGNRKKSAMGRTTAVLIGALLGGLLLGGCHNNPGSSSGVNTKEPLKVDADTYRKMVVAFYKGVAALDVGAVEDTSTRGDLEEATKLVPGEPASWADLAVLDLRANNIADAAKALQTATDLAPPNSQIEFLWGVTKSQQSAPAEAMDHFRKAIALDPTNLRARYSLIQELTNQNSPTSQGEIERQYQGILKYRPDNLVALVELARAAVLSGHAEIFHSSLDRLQSVSALWPAEARDQLNAVKKAATSGDKQSEATAIVMLQHLIAQTSPYQRSLDATTGRLRKVADPIERFIRLPSPSPTPAPPDDKITFTAQTAGTKGAAWAYAVDLNPGYSGTPGSPAETPAIVSGSAKGVKVGSVTLPFPGGKSGAAAGPDSVLAMDWNNNGTLGLVMAGAGGIRFFSQAAPGKWADVTAPTHLPAAILGGAYTGAWAADIDQDGDLDIVLGSPKGSPVVLRNNGDGTWGVLQPFPGVSGLRALVWADLDGDSDPDIALLDGVGQLVVFSNQRSGQYRKLPPPAGLGIVQAISVADENGDGTLDLIVLATGGSIRRLTYTGSGWEVAEIARWPDAPTDGTARLLWADLDNNGAPDLVASGSHGSRVWLGGTGGALQELPTPIDARVLSVVDLNGDGRLDLAGTARDGSPVELINHGVKSYHWQTIRPRSNPAIKAADPDHPQNNGNDKINSFGLGGTIEVRAGLLVEKQPITGPAAQFGIGDNEVPDLARIVWPSGQPQAEFDLKGDGTIVALQRLTASCPWLFAWDGKAMKFVTDILWKSPLGLRINAQDTAGVSQTTDWVKVRGDQLQPRDGFYDLKITAELWEADFFDMVRLMAVDHPIGADVFVDERFSIPQPPLALHAMGPVQPVIHAIDDLGNDVTDVLATRDGRYLDTFGLGQYQGITRDHWVQMEVPDRMPRKGPLWLVAYGWVYPTDSSINVALSQGSHPRPEGLSLEVQDAHGKWVTARKGLGFPAGKNKTALIDLTGLWPPGFTSPRRLRLRTNLEIYWDSIGVATSQPPALLHTHILAPTTADLHYRGFSTISQPRRSTPEIPDYNHLASVGQQWLDLTGFYTRFGDVNELLDKVDDRYVIMNAGDEISLRFPALAPPPAGWVRDFVFVSDGWDKDGNFNTSYSKTVLPLPSHDHPAYNTPPGPLEDDPVYRRHPHDWEEYQTRYVTVDGFEGALPP